MYDFLYCGKENLYPPAFSSLLIYLHFSVSNCQIHVSEILITLFSGTERPTKLKLGTYLVIRQWVDVSRILESSSWCIFIPLFSFFFLSNFGTFTFLSRRGYL